MWRRAPRLLHKLCRCFFWSRCRSWFQWRTATALDAAATLAPAFPAVDPAAQFRGVELAVAAAYPGLSQALVGRTPTAAVASLATPASGSTPPGVVATAGGRRRRRGRPTCARSQKNEAKAEAGCYQNRFASHFNLSAGLCRAAISQFSKLLVSIGWGIAI